MYLSTSQIVSQKQSLVVTAQLQQAIHLLQLSNQDLARFIEEQSEENPFVELRVKTQTAPLPIAPRGGSDTDWDRIGNLAADPGPSLYAHATAEVDRLGLSLVDRQRAEAFLDALEPSGWLGQSLEMIALNGAMTVTEAEHLLTVLQTVEPAGLFARNLAECLRLQAAEQGILSPVFSAVLNNLPKLASADLKGLARVCACELDELRAVLRQLRGLNPKPGAVFDGPVSAVRPPDLIVTRGEDGWKVDLNRSTLPSVHVRPGEAARSVSRTAEGKVWAEERVNVARWLQRAVEHRNMTTLKVGAEVVKRQAEFLEHGPAHLRPMILREVADAIGVHESTVSRVTQGMLIQTPQGTLPLKTFFNAALGPRGDSAGSAAAVRHRIKQLVANENPECPLSDDTIVEILGKDGIELARRTVAKYRDMLNIPSSVQRRRQAVVSGAV